MTKRIDVAKAIVDISWSEFRDMTEDLVTSLKCAREDGEPWKLDKPDQLARFLWGWAEGCIDANEDEEPQAAE